MGAVWRTNDVRWLQALLAIHPRSSGRGILAFSRKKLQMQGARILRNEAYIEVRRNDER